MRYLWVIVLGCNFTYSMDMVKDRRTIEQLIDKAVNLIETKSISRACHDFISQSRWHHRLSSLFMMNYEGDFLFFDNDISKTRSFIPDLKTFDDSPAVHALIEHAESGHWLTLMWNNFFVHVFGRKVVKNNIPYIIGACTYHWCIDLNIKFLVNKARVLIEKKGVEIAKNSIGNPAGKFNRGVWSVSLYNTDGLCLANATNPRLTNRIITSLKDDSQHAIFDGFLKTVDGATFEGWYESSQFKTMRRDYIRKIYDPHTNQEVLAVAGYYPELNDNFVKNFVYKACDILEHLPHPINIEHLKKEKFREAGLYLMVFDQRGFLVANTEFPAAEGNIFGNSKNKKDSLIQTIIHMTQRKGETWVVTNFYGIPYAIFAKKVQRHNTTYIVCAFNYMPEMLHFESVAIAHSLHTYLEELEEPFIQYITHLPRTFLKPGLDIEIYSPKGYCVGGNHLYNLWKRAPRAWWIQAKNCTEAKWIVTSERYGRYHHYTVPFKHAQQKYILSVGYYYN